MFWRAFLPSKSGVRLLVSGKFFGKMRARKKMLTFLIIKRQSIGIFSDYHNTNIITKYGIFSLKTWITSII